MKGPSAFAFLFFKKKNRDFPFPPGFPKIRPFYGMLIALH